MLNNALYKNLINTTCTCTFLIKVTYMYIYVHVLLKCSNCTHIKLTFFIAYNVNEMSGLSDPFSQVLLHIRKTRLHVLTCITLSNIPHHFEIRNCKNRRLEKGDIIAYRLHIRVY